VCNKLTRRLQKQL